MMITNAPTIKGILAQVEQLSAQERLQLIQQISVMLSPNETQPPSQLKFGKYRGQKMSTLEDFKIAEWHPAGWEFDGD